MQRMLGAGGWAISMMMLGMAAGGAWGQASTQMTPLGVKAPGATAGGAAVSTGAGGATVAAGGAAAAADKVTVRVGSDAPALKVVKWVKGTPVEGFKEGEVYVVEFWATWCGPCKTSIPHLTEMAKKDAGKATMIGVSVFEHPTEDTNEAVLKLVEPFVKEMGEKMEYNVAVDGVSNTMATTWMEAAGQGGIPTAFIVGRDRKIAWIGHPMEMEKPLDEVIAGTFDVKAEIARQTKVVQDRAEMMALVAPITEAIRAKDNAAIVAAVDKVLAAKPDMEGELMPVRMNALMQTDEAAAFGYMKELLAKGFFDKQPVAAYNAWSIVASRGAALKNPDYTVMVSALEKANGAMKDEPAIEAAYAEALFRNGDTAKAIAMEKKVISDAEAKGPATVPQAWVDARKKRLEEFQAKK